MRPAFSVTFQLPENESLSVMAGINPAMTTQPNMPVFMALF
jgi:hypothetical protein